MTAHAVRDYSVTHPLQLGGFRLTPTTTEALTQRLTQALDHHEKHLLFFANTNFVVKCQALQKKMHATNSLIVNDGIGVDIATWLIHRKKFSENLNGTDFIPQFLHHAKNTARVFLFGAKPGIAERAALHLKECYGINVVGTCNGYRPANAYTQLVDEINAANANVILVAMGNPAQEQWILDYHQRLNASIFIGVGALLDFLAGDKPRAPRLVQQLRLEWLYRLGLEPKRLLRRYTLDIAAFLALCVSTERAQKTETPIS